MAKQRKFLVLDTETATLPCVRDLCEGDRAKTAAITMPLIYDIGYVIVNASGKILKRVNHLVQEVYSNPKLFQTAYYAYKRPLYDKMLEEGTIDLLPWDLIIAELYEDLQEVEMSAAFNATFDFKKALPYTMDFIYYRYKAPRATFDKWYNRQQIKCEEIAANHKSDSYNPDYMKPHFSLWGKQFPITDLWTLTCEYFAKGKVFKKFAIKNHKLTNSAIYFSTTAESVYQYYQKDLEFNETHTALNDAEIEAVILTKLIKAKAYSQSLKAFPFKALGTTVEFVKEYMPKYAAQLKEDIAEYAKRCNINLQAHQTKGYWGMIQNQWLELNEICAK